jgi:hypothetical protein
MSGTVEKRRKQIVEDPINGLSLIADVIGVGISKFQVASHNYGAAAVDWTATAGENRAQLIIATNANGAVNAIFKARKGQIILVANSTGYALTVKGPSPATGVSVTNGTVVWLYGTGTDFASIAGTTGGGAGSFTTLAASSTVTLSPVSANVAISPTGTGTVTISPVATVAISPTGVLTVNPTAASTMNNVAIGGSTPLAGAFTTVDATTSIKLKGSSTGKAVIATANSSGSDYTATLPAATDTIALIAATQTLTNKTITGAVSTDWSRCSSQQDATSNITLANVTGLVATVVPGTYAFVVNLPGTATANGGIKVAFKLTTTVLTSIEATGKGFTASALVTQHTTTTADQTLLLDSQTAIIDTVIRGSMVVGTGGTIQMQMAQHASHADTSSVYAGATMQFTRIA